MTQLESKTLWLFEQEPSRESLQLLQLVVLKRISSVNTAGLEARDKQTDVHETLFNISEVISAVISITAMFVLLCFIVKTCSWMSYVQNVTLISPFRR